MNINLVEIGAFPMSDGIICSGSRCIVPEVCPYADSLAAKKEMKEIYVEKK